MEKKTFKVYLCGTRLGKHPDEERRNFALGETLMKSLGGEVYNPQKCNAGEAPDKARLLADILMLFDCDALFTVDDDADSSAIARAEWQLAYALGIPILEAREGGALAIHFGGKRKEINE